MAQVKVRNSKFIDIDLSFRRHPVTGDVSKIVDENAIIRSVKNLIRTNMMDKKFHPEISSPIDSLLFETFTPVIQDSIQKTIQNIIENFEPRVELETVEVTNFDDNKIKVIIQFIIIGTIETVTAQFFIKRTI